MSDTNNEVRASVAPGEKRPSQAKRPSQGSAVAEGEPRASAVPRLSQGSTGGQARRSQGSTGGQGRLSVGGGEQPRASAAPPGDQPRASAVPNADQPRASAIPASDDPRASTITSDQPRVSGGDLGQPRGSGQSNAPRLSNAGQRLSMDGRSPSQSQQPRLSQAGADQPRRSSQRGSIPGEEGQPRLSQGQVMEEPPPQGVEGLVGASLGNPLNERTYQEVEYLKRSLGPILVAALAEICIRRPADPIEYLGHWLLRWRYNEELKRRDVQNALEVVRKKTWADEQGLPDPNAPEVPPAPENYGSGFIPQHPYGPPGYGGPLSTDQVLNALAEDMPPLEEEEAVLDEAPEFQDAEEGLEMPPPPPEELAGDVRPSLQPQGSVAAAEGEKLASLKPEGSVAAVQEKRASLGEGGERRASEGAAPRKSMEEKRVSLKGDEKRPSVGGEEKRPSVGGEEKRASLGGEKRASLTEKRASVKAEGGDDAPQEVPPPAE